MCVHIIAACNLRLFKILLSRKNEDRQSAEENHVDPNILNVYSKYLRLVYDNRPPITLVRVPFSQDETFQ